jgi:group I intron endonuclease
MEENLQMYDGYIYRLYCSVTNKSYIGKTRQKLNRRLDHHFACANRKSDKSYNYHIYRAIRKYGKDGFTISIIDHIIDTSKYKLDERLYDLETTYIQLFDSFKNGYNSDLGGRGSKGVIHSEETKLKMKTSRSKRKPITEETRNKMKASAKLRVSIHGMHKAHNARKNKTNNNESQST